MLSFFLLGSFTFIFPLWPRTVIHLKKIFPVRGAESHLHKMNGLSAKDGFPFFDLLVYRKANIPLPASLVPGFLQVATLLEVSRSISLNLRQNYSFGL